MSAAAAKDGQRDNEPRTLSKRLAARRPGISDPICYRLGVKLFVAIVLAIYFPFQGDASTAEWTSVRSSHFEVFSQAGERDGRAALGWFEQLRTFFVQTAGLGSYDLNGQRPVRVIGFKSAKEYAAFRLQATADAYFIGAPSGDYIVMPALSADQFGVAAHEYAHFVLHSLGMRLAPWLAEGIAELFSTIRIDEQRCFIGGDLPMRSLVLRRKPWIPLPQLLTMPANSSIRASRDQADIFYAESWALANMLVFSPAYAARFGELLATTASGAPDAETVTRIYGKPISALEADLRAWLEKPRTGTPLPGIPSVSQHIEVSELTAFESDRIMADLLFASGDLDRAAAAYKKLESEQPQDAAVAAARGSIALRKGDRVMAREQWERAIHLGIQDARLCYQYAILAEDAGLPTREIEAALRRAVQLDTNFDDARYTLGLLESNRGDYAAALEQLQAMHSVAPERAYGYWLAMAAACNETDRREEAKNAAAKAMRYAATPEERASASRLAYIADTDLTVQLAKDAKGNLQMITTRKPHGSGDWNPFIEPGDHIRSVEGQIQKVECASGKITGFRIATQTATLEVTLPDPAHVLIGGGTPEFFCGADDERKVAIQYAAFDSRAGADGVLRGMQFK